MYINNATFAKRYSRPAHCCMYSYKHRCLHMHINTPIHILCTYISEWHRQCTCTYTRTHAHVHIYSRLYQPSHCRLYQPPHNRMYQPTTGCISTATAGCISPPPHNVLAHHRLDQPRHACIASCLCSPHMSMNMHKLIQISMPIHVPMYT